MKTVCKKLFSLMLVALLLVSALPFQASAAGNNVTIYNGSAELLNTNYAVNGKTISAVLSALVGANWNETYHFVQYEVTGTNAAGVQTGTDTAITFADGDYLWVLLGEHTLTTNVTDANCDTAGSKVTTCGGCTTYSKTETIAALGHKWTGDWTVINEPTCIDKGSKTRTCSVCGTKTEDIPATGIHNYVNGKCKDCGAPEDANDTTSNYALTFHYLNSNGTWTSSMVAVKPGDTISLPNIPLVSGKDHIAWNTLQNGAGDAITAGTKWYNGMARDIYAIYEVDSTEDGLVDLSVYAHYYIDGEYHHKVRLYVKEFEETSKNTMFTWLYSNDGVAATNAALAEQMGANGYQWNPVLYYDYYDDGAVTEADLKSDGNKSVYIKVTSKKAIEATVLLHVHAKKEYAIARTITMPGYTAGDYVSQAEALAAVKKFYTGSKMAISDLYDESDWDDLMAGLKSSGAKSVKVENNGTTEIHVILSNATAKNSSNADTTNPKTGDYIMIAAGTMVLAAAAVITLAELKKRKMI